MALLLAAGVLLLVGYWIGPLRPLPAQIELLAVAGDVAVSQVRAEPRRTAQGGVVFAVPLAVRNVGAQSARPRRLVLNVPAYFRLTSERGQLKGEVTAGVPLRRYVVELPAPRLDPGAATQRLPGLDTIFLEPDLPRYYCELQGVQVPEFMPAPRYDATTLSDVRIFYSFAGTAGPERHTGVITVQLDPALLQVTPAALPPAFRTELEEPEARAPDLGPLSFAGARAAVCGDPEQPIQVYTVQWDGRDGGRMHVVFVDGEPRKRLYDLNRDGIVDLETWDASGDGRFEARRDARYAVPEFLLPLPPRDPSLIEPDPVPPDSAWLALFHRHADGPTRFAGSSLTPHPQITAADTVSTDTTVVTRPDESLADLADVTPATPEFLALFADTLAGPFRFSPRRTAPLQATSPAPAAPTAETAEVVADTTPPAAPAPRPRRAPLGTPIRQ
jgi:hypothetical protein